MSAATQVHVTQQLQHVVILMVLTSANVKLDIKEDIIILTDVWVSKLSNIMKWLKMKVLQ